MLRFACVVIGAFAGLVASVPADARKVSDKHLCLSDASMPYQRIVACSALIRSGGHDPQGGASAFLSRAAAYGQQGDYRRAIEDATQAIKRAPSPVAYYTRALAYHNLDEEEQAIRDCDAALKIEPNNANALFVRGAAHQGMADYAQAIEDFTRVIQIDPERGDAFFARGAANYSAGKYERAADDLNRSAELGLTGANVF